MNNQKPTILITGGAGFIGSNFITYFLQEHSEYQLVNIDKLTYAGSTENLNEIKDLPNYHFINGDIADEQLVKSIFSDFPISGVIHFAAESHVDRSIQDAKQFVEANVVGTTVLLQAARNAWERLGVLHERRFHQISTDEIYGSLDETGKFNEQTPYNPRNPYSASKASANLLVKSFGYTYGMNIVISSSSNNYGPRQHEEKLIPTIIAKALSLESIPIYGDGKNIRDWLYVTDHCQALDFVYHHGNTMETYNIGGGNELTNIEVAIKICQILDQLKPDIKARASIEYFADLITYTEDRPGHDRRYAVDDTKTRKTLGWKPVMTFEQGIRQTVEWYVNKWEKVTH
ncbi:dTDP-glucose 4,6-dehydratase [Virgibacillus dakarensis]|uniref:dTDP-glucose 4,6-dehydratase n=1 Tax=Lentibacillus populi TaxID=1827502 RepID=A0A9W5X553_9BACI|nr:dTDP-glucose 4,6-dehydratase [Lentibacillus populi]MBT2218207.1 dTDP-glucose 4,6-dehydratase [Virgibacillus dakarensis]MTW87979.1 dTDP-glucose 4,6-dehydratase [Virgibacillus dakarensis]GGB37773.1 dTDP-glucose 4,6-dehydratase [Lentibacillus populi]